MWYSVYIYEALVCHTINWHFELLERFNFALHLAIATAIYSHVVLNAFSTARFCFIAISFFRFVFGENVQPKPLVISCSTSISTFTDCAPIERVQECNICARDQETKSCVYILLYANFVIAIEYVHFSDCIERNGCLKLYLLSVWMCVVYQIGRNIVMDSMKLCTHTLSSYIVNTFLIMTR